MARPLGKTFAAQLIDQVQDVVLADRREVPSAKRRVNVVAEPLRVPSTVRSLTLPLPASIVRCRIAFIASADA
jgi:hypothetical protein